LQLIADIIAIWIGFAIQLHLRFFSKIIETAAIPTSIDYILGSIMMTGFWITMFAIFGMYKNWYAYSPFSEFYSTIKVSFFGCLIIVFFLLTDNSNYFRALFLIYFVISVFTFTFFRFITRRIQIKLRKKGIVKIPTLIIGDLKHSIEFYKNTLKSKSWGYNVKGIILYEKEKSDNDKKAAIMKDSSNDNLMLNNLILGTINDVYNIIDKIAPEEIVLSAGTPNSKLLFEIEEICQRKNIRLSIFPNLYDHFTGRTKTQDLYGIPLIEVSFRIIKPIQLAIKRTFDIVFSLLVLGVGLPLWTLIAVIIKLESEGNVIYSQPRIGKNNKIFTIYKFRSMMQNKTNNKLLWTMKNDPRVTKFGKFIRKSHLDEIPQFFNVLIGDMSIVGPRPESVEYVEIFASQLIFYNRRHIVRPGITGWNHVHRPLYELGIEEVKIRTKYDFYYIENFSLQLDFEIMVRTIWVMLTLKGQA
jgi:exopolysaccharide biosynthesis polyprenyl glycosylphosphotransferase